MVDGNAGGGALCCRGGGALCIKWWMRMREVGRYAAEVGHYVSSGGGIMLQVVDANAGGGALCFKWSMRMDA